MINAYHTTCTRLWLLTNGLMQILCGEAHRLSAKGWNVVENSLTKLANKPLAGGALKRDAHDSSYCIYTVFQICDVHTSQIQPG